jgi:hypothetical protein
MAGGADAVTKTAKPQAISAAIAGTYTLTTDWGCDGSITGSFSQTFNANRTWSSSPFIHSGFWYQVGNTVVWTFSDTANLVYSGQLNGSFISGVQGYTQSGGITGCFTGQLGFAAAGTSGAKGDAALGR